jgi:hypothetical protein
MRRTGDLVTEMLECTHQAGVTQCMCVHTTIKCSGFLLMSGAVLVFYWCPGLSLGRQGRHHQRC